MDLNSRFADASSKNIRSFADYLELGRKKHLMFSSRRLSTRVCAYQLEMYEKHRIEYELLPDDGESIFVADVLWNSLTD